jgi:hypothetical protein
MKKQNQGIHFVTADALQDIAYLTLRYRVLVLPHQPWVWMFPYCVSGENGAPVLRSFHCAASGILGFNDYFLILV